MLLETQTREVASSGILETARATIKATPKIFSFFADQTYANKPLAICRELAANAIDAHTAANNLDPIEVWLPNDLDPTFRVRDYGIGMPHDFVMGPFMAYTDGSTKDSSNDQIGGFGIGSKSPFAYTDQFTLRVVHNGTVSLYSMFMDEDSIPSVGLLGQKPTNEANGVEVSFPVHSEDFGTFANAANEALKYFHPLPIIKNGEIDAPHYISRGALWAMRQQSGPLAVIMGGVRYPVETSNISYEIRYDDKIAPLLDYGLDLTLPIGTCGVALSRESLSYDSRTEAGLRAALYAVIDEIAKSFGTMFDDCETEWEAKKRLCEELPVEAYRRSGRAKLLASNAVYKGQPLTPEVAMSGETWTIDRPRRSNKVSNAKWEITSNFKNRLDNYEVVILDDLPQSPKSRTIQRIKTYVDESCRRHKPILVLRDVTFDVDIPDDEFVLTSSLPEPPKAEPRAKGSRPKVRMFTVSALNSQSWRPPSYGVAEIHYASQPDSGILVVCDNFTTPTNIERMFNTRLVIRDECHFVNKNDAQKLSVTDWPRVETVFAERLSQFLADNPDTPNALAVRHNSDLKYLFDDLKHIAVDDLKPKQLKQPIGKIIALRDTYSNWNINSALAGFVEAKLPPRLNVEKLIEHFKNQHAKANRFLKIAGRISENSLDKSIFLELL